MSDWSDEDIAREYHWRMMRKLGDPRIGVSTRFLTGYFNDQYAAGAEPPRST